MTAQTTPPEHLEPIWTAIADGAQRTGHLRDADHDVARCIAINALAALQVAGYLVVPADVDHVLDLGQHGWTLQHPIACRLSGSLLDCAVNAAVSAAMAHLDEPEQIGRFLVTLDEDGCPIIGAPVERS
jgi:hypothetical protein